MKGHKVLGGRGQRRKYPEFSIAEQVADYYWRERPSGHHVEVLLERLRAPAGSSWNKKIRIRILEMVHVEGRSYRQIGEIYGMDRQRIFQVYWGTIKLLQDVASGHV